MTEENLPARPESAEYSDNDFQSAMTRGLKTLILLGLLGIPLVWLVSGWQSAVLFVVGAFLAGMGLWDWRRMAEALFARMDAGDTKPKPVFGMLVRFFLRLGLAVGLLYVSLKCLNGSVYALLAGLGLAMVSLSLEAFRQARRSL